MTDVHRDPAGDPQTQGDTWAENLDEELDFWRRSLAADDEVGELHRRRLTPSPLPDWIREAASAEDPVLVLDVGSGPLTTIGDQWPGRDVRVTAVDPLADEYNAVLDDLALVPPVRAIRGFAESLSDLFPDDHFHVVNTANALDHCADPVTAILQMMRITRPNGLVRLHHLHNVGELEHYHGLHQWNLCPEGDNDMAIWNPRHRTMLSELAPGWDRSVQDLGETFLATLVKPPA